MADKEYVTFDLRRQQITVDPRKRTVYYQLKDFASGEVTLDDSGKPRFTTRFHMWQQTYTFDQLKIIRGQREDILTDYSWLLAGSAEFLDSAMDILEYLMDNLTEPKTIIIWSDGYYECCGWYYQADPKNPRQLRSDTALPVGSLVESPKWSHIIFGYLLDSKYTGVPYVRAGTRYHHAVTHERWVNFMSCPSTYTYINPLSSQVQEIIEDSQTLSNKERYKLFFISGDDIFKFYDEYWYEGMELGGEFYTGNSSLESCMTERSQQTTLYSENSAFSMALLVDTRDKQIKTRTLCYLDGKNQKVYDRTYPTNNGIKYKLTKELLEDEGYNSIGSIGSLAPFLVDVPSNETFPYLDNLNAAYVPAKRQILMYYNSTGIYSDRELEWIEADCLEGGNPYGD